uniref:Uncharacterized protein n=1 Tax=Arundo donax TaxID=35708 RepID=A0A0A9DNG9_ARUDO
MHATPLRPSDSMCSWAIHMSLAKGFTVCGSRWRSRCLRSPTHPLGGSWELMVRNCWGLGGFLSVSTTSLIPCCTLFY